MAVNRPVEITETIQEPQPSGPSITRKVTKTITQSTPIPLDSSRISVDLRLQHRQKGLLWYDTYTVTFEGRYVVHNPDAVARVVVARLKFPSSDAPYNQFTLRLNGIEAPPVSNLSEVEVHALLAAGAEAPLEVRYSSRGLDEWFYAFAESGVTQVHDLALTMTTDFADVDFPPGTMSPTMARTTTTGRKLDWKFESLVTGQAIGLDLPDKTNPGPLAARITFFAPVSLLFFTTVLVILGILNDENLHPMNYAFLSAAFFAFHLLLAYLVDHLNIHLSFVLAIGDEHLSGRDVLAHRGGQPVRHTARRTRAARIPRVVQLRVLLQGLHRPHGHRRRDRDAVRPDAGHGAVSWPCHTSLVHTDEARP